MQGGYNMFDMFSQYVRQTAGK